MRLLAASTHYRLLIALAAPAIFAAAPLGVVKTPGSVLLNSSVIHSNATLFDNSVVQTQKSTAVLTLRGSVIQMAAGSKVTVRSGHAIVESGKIQLAGQTPFTAEAGGVRVTPDAGGEAIVVREAAATQVGALRGSVKVMNSEGMLLASLNTGSAMSFSTAAPQSGATTKTKLTGQISQSGNGFQITTAEGSVFDVFPCANLKSGIDDLLKRSVGKKADLVGEIDSQRQRTANAKPAFVTCELPVAQAAGQSTATAQTAPAKTAGTVTKTGMSVGTKAAIAGVVATAIVIPTAIVATRDDSTPASR